jgi:hypothetical protein
MVSDRMLIEYYMIKRSKSEETHKNILPLKSLSELSLTVKDYLHNLRNVKENDKIYIGFDKKVYKDGFSIFQPIMRTFLLRNRNTTIEQLEKLFNKYFLLVDKIFSQEKENDKLIAFHYDFVDEMINGIGNLKFTYEDSRSFIARADKILLKLFYIKRIISNGTYKYMNIRSVSCSEF